MFTGFYLFVSFPVTSQSGTSLASTMLSVVLRVKEVNGESYTLYWMELEEFLLMLGCLETWKRGFVFAPCEGNLEGGSQKKMLS